VVGLILGPLAEQQLRRALAISQGDPTVLVGSPVAIILLAIAALALFGPLLWRLARPAGAPASLASDTD
jgi:putative tricarboxylic transport membrane protein